MGKNERKWRLTTPRSLDGDGNLLPHDASRHGGDGRGRFNPEFGSAREQGTTFPPHVRRGDITKLSKTAQNEYDRWRKGQPSEVIEAKESGGAWQLFIRLGKFGIAILGMFVRDHEVATIFPQQANGKNRLGYKGEKYKKSPK